MREISIIDFARMFLPEIKSRSEISKDIIDLFENKEQITIIKPKEKKKVGVIQFASTHEMTVVSKNRDYIFSYNNSNLVIIDDMEE